PLERGEELSHVSSMGSFQTLAEGMLGAVNARLGDLPAATIGWNLALERAVSTEDRYGEATTLWQRAAALEQATDHAAALVDIDVKVEVLAGRRRRPVRERRARDDEREPDPAQGDRDVDFRTLARSDHEVRHEDAEREQRSEAAGTRDARAAAIDRPSPNSS